MAGFYLKYKLLLPVDRKKKTGGIAEEFVLLRVSNFANKLDERMIEQWFDHGFKIFAIRAIDFRGNLQWNARTFGNLDGIVQTFFWGRASQKRKISTVTASQRQGLPRQTVMDGSLPICALGSGLSRKSR